MTLLFQPGLSLSGNQIIPGLIFFLLLAFISIHFKLLTLSGGFAAFILALLLFGLGGWNWIIPVVSFFITSGLLSRIRETINPSVNVYFEKSGSRDFYQVAANGGLGGVLVLLNYFIPDKIWFCIYSGIIASSCADTWATEIGTMKKHNTYNILNFRKVEPGSSGGVSFAGLSGAFLGALFISLTSVIWIDKNQTAFVTAIIIAGFIASIFDSFLGAAPQVQYKCSGCGRIIDKKIHCGMETIKYRGISFINNDLVNFVSGLLGGAIAFSITGR